MTLRFVGIGAMRAGTAWTYFTLDRHAQVAFPAGKEAHFLDRDIDAGFDWYASRFDSPAGVFDGDITPAYAIVDDSAVAALNEHFDDLRVFFIIRDPIERAWSSAQLTLRLKDIDPASLDTQWFIERMTRRSVRQRSDYASTVDRWRRYFGARLWVADFAGLKAHPQNFLVSLCEHIGLDPSPFASPDDQIATAMTQKHNQTNPVVLPQHIDRDQIEEALIDAYAADRIWYQNAEIDWRN